MWWSRIELFVIAWVRYRFLTVSLRSSLIVVTVGRAIVLAVGWLSATPELRRRGHRTV